MTVIINLLKKRKKAMRPGKFLNSTISRYSLSVNATRFVRINKHILNIIKHIYTYHPNDCESYRLHNSIKQTIDETDPVVKYWRKTIKVTKEDILKNCNGMVLGQPDEVKIADYIYALLVDILCVFAVATFV